MTIQIRIHEKKISSQNGEDGILEYIFGKLASPNFNFIEIGCSDGSENNSRNLIQLGLSGTGVDISWKKLLAHRALLGKAGQLASINLKCMRITTRNATELLRWHGLAPDVFSLDIDSYDYFIADRLLRQGFRPSIACLETNTFLGRDAVTVDYIPAFARYDLQPEYGLYFGASPAAWRALWTSYGYVSLGLDSSGTNIFFVLPERLADPTEMVVQDADVHQKLFVEKYKKSGEELSSILRQDATLRFLDVGSADYEARFRGVGGDASYDPAGSALFVTTFIKKTYDEVAYKLVESFDKHWPRRYELLALGENCDVLRPSIRVLAGELERASNGLTEFKARHRFNPGANGRFGASYYYVFDGVKWSHKVFAVEAAANCTDAEFVIYIDSDIVTFADVPIDFLESLVPDDADVAYLPRQNMYSECSFVIYRQRNSMVRGFIFEHAEMYRKDILFQLQGWTDCHAFDFLVRKYSRAGLLKFHNINEGVPMSSHPFINGPLGRYMDHMKGARKASGKSYESDLVVERTEKYWLAQGASE